MTAVALPTNIYYTRNPSQVAQEKYSNASWSKDCASVTIVAFTALALIANVFLFSSVPLAGMIGLDAGFALAGYYGVWPITAELFATGDKLQAQGDKETRISAKLQELRALAPAALRNQFRDLGNLLDRLPDAELPQRPEVALLARVLYREEQANNLARKRNQFFHDGNYREALETDIARDKARVKAAFFSMLIENPNIPGKFKNSFRWMDYPAEERALWAACTPVMIRPHNVPYSRDSGRMTPDALMERRDRHSGTPVLHRGEVENRLAGDLGRSLLALLYPPVCVI